MPGSTPRQALDNYIRPLQRALSCVTTAVLRHSGWDVLSTPKVLTTAEPARLSGNTNLYVTVSQHYQIIEDPANGPYKIRTRAYMYTLEDEASHEILGYHWHPESRSRYKFPHLHLGQGAYIGRAELESTKAHLPTGRVPLEEFIGLIIETFDVPGRREDWQQILEETRSAFKRYSTWS